MFTSSSLSRILGCKDFTTSGHSPLNRKTKSKYCDTFHRKYSEKKAVATNTFSFSLPYLCPLFLFLLCLYSFFIFIVFASSFCFCISFLWLYSDPVPLHFNLIIEETRERALSEIFCGGFGQWTPGAACFVIKLAPTVPFSHLIIQPLVPCLKGCPAILWRIYSGVNHRDSFKVHLHEIFFLSKFSTW